MASSVSWLVEIMIAVVDVGSAFKVWLNGGQDNRVLAHPLLEMMGRSGCHCQWGQFGEPPHLLGTHMHSRLSWKDKNFWKTQFDHKCAIML